MGRVQLVTWREARRLDDSQAAWAQGTLVGVQAIADGRLVLVDPGPPVFQRESVAYLSNGQQVAVNQPRYETIGGITGWMSEEGTTNLIADADTLTSHSHGVTGDSSQITLYDASLSNGVYHIHFARTGSSGSDYRLRAAPSASSYPITIDKTKDYVWSVDIKVAQGSPIEFWVLGTAVIDTSPQQKRIALIINKTTAQADNGCTILSYAPIGDGWYRLVVRIPPSIWTGSGTTARVEVFTAWTTVGTYEYYYRRPQFEQKQYATSWTVGTRAAETLTVPTAGMNPKEWTIEFWAYLQGDLLASAPTRNITLFATATQSYTHNVIEFSRQANQTNRWFLRTTNGSAVSSNAGGVWSPTQGWHYFALRANTSASGFFIDGQKIAEINTPTLPDVLNAVASLGYAPWISAQYSNTLIGPLRISRRARTDQEIAAVAAAGTGGLVVDEDTTYYLPGDSLAYGRGGYRVAPAIALTHVGTAWASRVSWTAEGSGAQVLTSLDGGQIWTAATNGGPVPGISRGMDVSGKTLMLKQRLLAQDMAAAPVLTMSDAVVMAEPQRGADVGRVRLVGSGAGRVRIL